jgi:hypothetical protein
MNGAGITASLPWEKQPRKQRRGGFEICSRCALVRSGAQDDLMNFYRLLLHLYPSSFRAEYGEEMSAIFALELERSRGLASRCGVWLSAFTEILFNAAVVHWEIARRDLFHSARSLLRSPGFTVTAFLLITIGIGANVAVFTLANFVLVRPLPFPQPNQLTKVWLAGVRPADALTFSTAAAVCLITILPGTLFPALRAVRADPTAIMRAE